MSITLGKVRRQVAGFSLAMLIASMFAVGIAQAATFTDVKSSDWYYPYVEDLAAQGILNTSFTTYRPGDLVNRAEMVKLAVEAWNLTLETPTTAPFKDVPLGQWYTPYVYTALKNNIVGGYKNENGDLTGYFGPGDALTRDQAMKIITLAAPLTNNVQGGPHFGDVPLTSWSYEYVETGYNWSVVDGYPDGTFKPGKNINRAEIAKMVSNALKPVARPGAGFNVTDASAMTATTVEVCFSEDVGNGADVAANYSIKDVDGNTLTVSAAVKATDTKCVDLTTASQTESKNYDLIVSGVTSATGDSLDISDVSFTGFSAIGVGGNLSCTLGADVPGISLPKGASGVTMLQIDCSATTDPVVVTGLTFNRFGSGLYGDFSNLYLYEGANRLTTGRSINSETNDVTFGGLNYTIAAGKTVTFAVVGDIAGGATSSDQHAFQLVSKDMIQSNSASVVGTYPIKGNYFTISGATAGKVTITKNGSLDDVVIGSTGATIAQFQIEDSGTEAVNLSRIALYSRGTCRSSDVTNLKLYTVGGSEVLATADTISAKDLATFVLANPYTISQGSRKIFYVTADVLCRNGENIKTYLDQPTDLLVTGVTYGTGVQVCSSPVAPCTGSYNGTTAGANYSLVNVKGSKFNVSFAGPSATNVAIGQKAVAMMKLNITNSSGEDVEIKDWQITMNITSGSTVAGALVDNGGPTANYTLIKLAKLDSSGNAVSTLLGPSELSTAAGYNDTTQPVTLSGDTMIAAGASINAAVIMDVASNVNMDGDKLRVTLTNLTSGVYVKDINGDALDSASIVPSADIIGNIMTISKAGLKAAIASTPSSRSYSKGSNDAALAGFALTSGSSMDNTIKSLTITGYIDANADGTYVKGCELNVGGACAGVAGDVFLKNVIDNNVGLYNGTTLVSDFKNINNDGSLVFNNLNIAIAKSATVTLTLKGHVSNSAPFSNPTNVVKFGINSSSDMVVLDQNAQTVSTASIAVTDAMNTSPTPLTGVAADTKMTIISSGYGSTANSSVSNIYALASSVTTEVTRLKFTSVNEDATLNNMKLAVLDKDAKTISSVSLYKNSACDSLLGTYPVVSGFVNVESLGLALSSSTDTIVCVKAINNTVPNDGVTKPLSGSNVGIGLVNISEVLSGSGENVAAKYAGDATGTAPTAAFAVVGTTPITAVTNPLTIAAVAADNVDTTGSTLVPVVGDVLIIDGEYMLVTVAAAPNYTVQRGFAGTTAASHNTGAIVTRSTITKPLTALTEIKVGDVTSPGTTYMLCVNPAAAGVATDCDNVLDFVGLGGAPVVLPVVGDARFFVHGPLSSLFRSVPILTLNALPSTSLADGAVVSAFKITPDHADVSFINGTSHIIVNYAFGDAGSTMTGTCNLDEKGGSTVATVAGPGTQTGVLDFTLFAPSPYSFSSAKDFEVKCNGMTITAGSGITLSTRFTTTGPQEPLQWNDGVINVTTAGKALFPSDLGPQTLTK